MSEKTTTDKQTGGMGDMCGGMKGQMGTGGNQMGGMGDMQGMKGQMSSGGGQMGGMGDMHGMMGQMGSGGNQMGGMGDMQGMKGQMGSGGSQMGGMGDMHGMKGQMGSGGNQMGGMGDMQGMKGQMGSGGSQMGGMTSGQGSGGSSEHEEHHRGAMNEATRTPAQNTSVLPAPQASLEDQMKIQELANKRMETGTALMTQGIVALSSARQKNDVRSMEEATRQIRDGLSQFDSGLSAQRALSEGVAPRDVGLRWFKEQMNLTSTRSEHGGDIFGISWFHFFVMVALIAFAVIMIWMYFFKMRRAAEVLGRVAESQDTGKQNPEKSPSKP